MIVATITDAADVDAFMAGLEFGVTAVFVVIGLLLVLSTVRRMLDV